VKILIIGGVAAGATRTHLQKSTKTLIKTNMELTKKLWHKSNSIN